MRNAPKRAFFSSWRKFNIISAKIQIFFEKIAGQARRMLLRSERSEMYIYLDFRVKFAIFAKTLRLWQR